MKVLLATNRNPHFITITEYIESALAAECSVVFFDDRRYFIPGRLRQRFGSLERLDLARINRDLLVRVRRERPQLVLVPGGTRLFPETIRRIRGLGAVAALWTIDPPRHPVRFCEIARAYDYCFTGGSEAYDLLRDSGHRQLHFLPFACDPAVHYPQRLSEEEFNNFASDIVFVGTVDPQIYPRRVALLEQLADLDLAVWGPGSAHLQRESPLRRLVRGNEVPPQVWRKIYAAAKIVLCMHWRDPSGAAACHQASPRVFETLACGKLLIVDDQKDVRALFRDKEDLVIFKDAGHLRQLIGYYLQHSDERQRIAQQGRERVLSGHTYRHRVRAILKTVFG